MEEFKSHSTSVVMPQLQRLSDTKISQHIFITHMRIANVGCALRRLPAAFYVSAEVDGTTTKTSNKFVSVGQNDVEWDEEILLPSNGSSVISFRVYGSFELGPRLGNGELLRQFKISVGEVLEMSERHEPVKFPIPSDEIWSSCSSPSIFAQPRICDGNEPITKSYVAEPSTQRQLESLTDEGHLSLQRYREDQNKADLDKAVVCFQSARDINSPDHPHHSTVIFNLANAMFIRCQVNSFDLDVPITLYRDALRLRPTGHPDHVVTVLELGLSLLARFQRRCNGIDMMEATKFLARVMELSPTDSYVYRAGHFALRMTRVPVSPRAVASEIPQAQNLNRGDSIQRARAILLTLQCWDPRRPALLARLGGLLYGRFQVNRNLVDIHEAISTLEHAVELAPNGHPHRPGCLRILGDALRSRFERLGNTVDVDKSVSALEEAVHLTLDNHPDKPGRLNSLSGSLLRRFERHSHMADLDKCISATQKAVRLLPTGNMVRLSYLGNLATSLLYRFRRLGRREDMEEFVSTYEEAVRSTPDSHPEKPMLLSNFGNALATRFQVTGDIIDINKSISMIEKAVHLIPDGHPDKLRHLGALGISLMDRFHRLGDTADLDKSILLDEETLRLTPDGHMHKPSAFHNLGASLLHRFGILDDLTDVNKSILTLQEAVRLFPDDHSMKPDSLNALGNSFKSRFGRLGDITDIDQSILMYEQAVRLIPDGHPIIAMVLTNLGASLRSRFERLGDLADVDKSVLMNENALQLTPSGHSARPERSSNLGEALLFRFTTLQNITDIDKAILMLAEAVRLTPGDDRQRPGRLSNLAAALQSRSECTGDSADVEQSIEILQEAICLVPEGHAQKPYLLGNLGNCLLRRFQCFKDPMDAEKSVAMLNKAIALTPDGHPDKPLRLSNLGHALWCHFEHNKDLVDMDKCVSMHEAAVRLTPDGHPDKPIFLRNLGIALMERFNDSSDPSDVSAAILHFALASRTPIGPTHIRFAATRRWVASAQISSDSQLSLLDAYSTAISLIPQLAWLGLSLKERHRVLADVADVARDAPAAALEAGDPETAVEWLEQGRTVVWSQFLQLRTPVDQLRAEHPTLAREFERISQELEHASAPDNVISRQRERDRSFEEEVQRHHALALRRETLLSEIRSLPSFDRFLLPKTIEQLVAQASSGPVIYLNSSRQRCDALIVCAEIGSVIPVLLPGITYQAVEMLQSVLRLVLQHSRLILSRDEISSCVPSNDDPASHRFLRTLLGSGDVEAVERAAKIKQQRISGYTPDDLFRWILACLWRDVVNPILQALGFSTPPTGKEDMIHIFWCPTGPFAFLPIHAAGLYGTTAATYPKLSDFAVSSYVPSLSALTPSTQKSPSNHSSNIRLVSVPQPPDDGQGQLASVKEEINHIEAISAKSPFVAHEHSDGTVEDVMAKMTNADWVHFACHGIQDLENPLNSGLCLANSRRLKLSDIIRLSRPQGGLAFLSACLTARGDETLSEESVHLAAGMLLAGYGGVIATMWSIMDNDAPKVARDVYERLFRDGQVPDTAEAAEALHYAVQRLRESGASFSSWVPFIHVGR